MEKHILIVTTTHDFLWKFERDNVDLLQRMGYVVHYAANLNEPAYRSDEARFQEMGVWAHHIDIARSPFLFAQNKRALRQLLWLPSLHENPTCPRRYADSSCTRNRSLPSTAPVRVLPRPFSDRR